ncbi:DUF5057 domain-containing protein [Histomonas meleagridis]|uniref:DUF5057 domain-containing protein n=1 Tax=Histomonas meleagridis TaxID=135588 RepID=UPI003559A9CA|nr:DUF5057 domain-containing protein [Histomonas meleagridis]KAH0803415.1 DUF5057 domain-containing protein [Histomonas meleagridis]
MFVLSFILAHCQSSQTISLNVQVNTSYASGKGGAYLNWSKIENQEIYYKVFQQSYDTDTGDYDTTWKQISTYKSGTRVNVLNIYPSQTDGNKGQSSSWAGSYNTYDVNFQYKDEEGSDVWHTLPKSASLKIWMEGGIMIDSDGSRTTFEPYGIDTTTGEQLIYVTPISINEFEERANDDEFLYNYSVIVFGTWDASTGYGITTETAEGAVTRYINKGYGFLAGHDSIAYNLYINGVATSLLSIRDLFGIKSQQSDNSYNGVNIQYQFISQQTITVVRKGLLTNYPYQIGDVGTVLTIPTTHTNYQATTGDVWMTLGTNTNTQADSSGLQHNFYLTTKDNTAMIQTGHSNCESTIEERKIFANTIYYLNQRTYETFAEDHSSQDYESPTVNLKYDEKSYRVNINGIDKGSKYRFKVQALLKSNDDVYAESEPVEVDVTTGVDRYIYIVTNNQSVTVDDLTNSTKDNYISLNSQQITSGMNVFVAAVDGAGNIGDIANITIPIPDATPSKSPSRSPTESPSPSRSPTESPTRSPSRSPSPSASASVSKTPSLSQSPHPTFSQSPLISTEMETQKHSYSYGITLSNTLTNSLTLINTISINNIYSSISMIFTQFSNDYTYVITEIIYYDYTVIMYSTYISYYFDFYFMNVYDGNDDKQNETGKDTNIFLIIGIVIGIIVFAVIIVTIIIIIRRNQKINYEDENDQDDEIDIDIGNSNETREINNYSGLSFKDIEEDPFANDFNEQAFVTHI